jgi:hypothetical protein
MAVNSKKITEENNIPSPIQLGRLLLDSLVNCSSPKYIPCNWTLARLKEQGILYIALWADRKGYISLSTDVLAQRKQLESKALVGLMQTELALERLSKVLADKVEFILYKGYSLANTIYPQAYLRPATDIDILVRVKDVHRLDTILRANHYCRYAHWVRGELPFQVSYLDPDENFVEAHFSLTQANRRLPQNELAWQESEIVSGIRMFKPEMNLLALAMHAETHHFCLPIMNYIDPALLAISNPWEPSKLHYLAKINQCQRSLGVFLAQTYCFLPDSWKNDQIYRLFHTAGTANIGIIRNLSSLIASAKPNFWLPILRALIVFLYATSFSAFIRSARDYFKGGDIDLFQNHQS